MAYLVMSFIGLVAILIVKSRWGPKRQAGFILALLIVGVMVCAMIELLSKPDVIQKGPSSLFAEIQWFDIILYFVMVAGMAGKYFYDAIGVGNRIRFQKWQLVKPLLVSPIVFGMIYGGIAKGGSSLLLLIFSFQNGFFWQTVLYKGDKGK